MGPHHGHITGTVTFDADNKSGGSLDYQASNGRWLHGVVTRGSDQAIDAHTAVAGKITSGSDDYTVHRDRTDYFTVKVVDGGTSSRNGGVIRGYSRIWTAMAIGSRAPTPPPAIPDVGHHSRDRHDGNLVVH